MANPATVADAPPLGTTTPSRAAWRPVGDPRLQLAWLSKELDRQLAAYRKRRQRDKRKAFGLQMATVSLSAAITVLLGLRTSGLLQQRLADVALALGAIVTVLAAAEAFFSHRGLWILRTRVVRDLQTLRRHLDLYTSGLGEEPPDPAVVQDVLAQLDEVLTADHRVWQQLRVTTPDDRSSSQGTPR